MVQSLNTKVDFTIKATSHMGLTTYGNIMIGDRAFEFYNERKVSDYIQVPWEEIEYIAASLLFKGKKISRFVIVTKDSGKYTFSSRDNKALLRAVRQYVDPLKMVRSLSFLDVIKRGVKALFKRK